MRMEDTKVLKYSTLTTIKNADMTGVDIMPKEKLHT
jgi:hypothetical protein